MSWIDVKIRIACFFFGHWWTEEKWGWFWDSFGNTGVVHVTECAVCGKRKKVRFVHESK